MCGPHQMVPYFITQKDMADIKACLIDIAYVSYHVDLKTPWTLWTPWRHPGPPVDTMDPLETSKRPPWRSSGHGNCGRPTSSPPGVSQQNPPDDDTTVVEFVWFANAKNLLGAQRIKLVTPHSNVFGPTHHPALW